MHVEVVLLSGRYPPHTTLFFWALFTNRTRSCLSVRVSRSLALALRTRVCVYVRTGARLSTVMDA